MFKPQPDDPKLLRSSSAKSVLDASSNHGRHAIVNCPSESCFYQGRSDNVKRHFKRKHLHSQRVPPNYKKVPPKSEALKHKVGASSNAGKEISSDKSKSISQTQSRPRHSKKNVISP